MKPFMSDEEEGEEEEKAVRAAEMAVVGIEWAEGGDP